MRGGAIQQTLLLSDLLKTKVVGPVAQPFIVTSPPQLRFLAVEKLPV